MAKSCPKCGCLDIDTAYHPDTGYCRGSWGMYKSRKDGEHLHYFCKNCEYDWFGPTLDAGEK